MPRPPSSRHGQRHRVRNQPELVPAGERDVDPRHALRQRARPVAPRARLFGFVVERALHGRQLRDRTGVLGAGGGEQQGSSFRSDAV
jgi:hypothetical protein